MTSVRPKKPTVRPAVPMAGQGVTVSELDQTAHGADSDVYVRGIRRSGVGVIPVVKAGRCAYCATLLLQGERRCQSCGAPA